MRSANVYICVVYIYIVVCIYMRSMRIYMRIMYIYAYNVYICVYMRSANVHLQSTSKSNLPLANAALPPFPMCQITRKRVTHTRLDII